MTESAIRRGVVSEVIKSADGRSIVRLELVASRDDGVSWEGIEHLFDIPLETYQILPKSDPKFAEIGFDLFSTWTALSKDDTGGSQG